MTTERPIPPEQAVIPTRTESAEHAEAIAGLARRMGPKCVDVVDVDELVAAIEATGVNDRVARQRYGLPTVFALGAAVLAYLQADRAHQMARLAAQERRPPRPAPYVGQALLRCSLYLTPVLLAAAAAEPLGLVPWPAPAAALVLGWAGGQALAYLGHLVGAHHGPGSATRLLAAGFGALAAAWSGVLALAPAAVLGGQRPMAYAITLMELAYFAAVATALVTRSERAVLLWTLPSWLAAGAALTGRWPEQWPVDIQWVLAGTIMLTVGRAFRHIATPGPATGGVRPGVADLARAVAYLLIGAGQAVAFVLVWRAAPGGSATAPAALPLLAAVPLLEVFVGWHTARLSVGLDAYDDHRAYRGHVRQVAMLTVGVLTPPLLAGIALATASSRLPFQLVHHPDAAALALALATGVLLAGVFAVVLLLATRRRLGAAAALAAAPNLLAIGLTLWPPAVHTGASGLAGPVFHPATGGTGGSLSRCAESCVTGEALLPNAALALTVVYAVGLAVTAYILLDHRSHR